MNPSYYSEIDLFYSPILVLIILLIAFWVQHKKSKENPVYRYYVAGLVVKIFGSILFLLIYTNYYGQGDTLNYIRGSSSMSGMFLDNFNHYFAAITGKIKWDTSWFYFNDKTTFPPYYMWRDVNARAVINLTSVINLVGLRSPMPTTILLSSLSYMGVWKLYLFFSDFYPHLGKRLTIAVLFLPSLVFWGSGVMKDTYTFAASGWFIFNLYMIFIKRRKFLLNILLALINAFIILKIKPYIFIALFPGTVIWLFFNPISRMKNRVLAIILVPVLIISSFLLISLIFSFLLKGQLGQYNSIDLAVEKAKTIQEDMTNAKHYGNNYYDIGNYGGSLSGLLKVAPTAFIAGLFRPFLWESRNIVMIISGLENFFLLTMTIYLLIRLKFVRFFQFVFSDPILVFSFLYVVFFMFAVGLACANFGALVRYKIPALPFFVASIFIMLDKYTKYKKKRGTEEVKESDKIAA